MSLETGIISLVGGAYCGGVLAVWGRDAFGYKADVEDEVEEKQYLIVSLYSHIESAFYLAKSFIRFLFSPQTVIEEEEWDGYKTEQDLPKQRPGKYELFL